MTCNCNTWRRWVLLTALVLAALAMSRGAAAQGVYFTNESVLKDMFASSEHVTYVQVAPEERDLGYPPAKKSYVVYIASTGARVDGYAVIDEQLGQHLPITIATKLSAEGTVERTEIMVYRERYGEEVRHPRFRDQFLGKSADDPMRAGDDVVAISGATISSSAVALAVRRAAVLARLAAAKAARAPVR